MTDSSPLPEMAQPDYDEPEPLTTSEALTRMTAGILELQLVLHDRLMPVVEDARIAIGRFWLALYLNMPWYRRLWWDIRHSRAVRRLRGLAR